MYQMSHYSPSIVPSGIGPSKLEYLASQRDYHLESSLELQDRGHIAYSIQSNIQSNTSLQSTMHNSQSYTPVHALQVHSPFFAYMPKEQLCAAYKHDSAQYQRLFQAQREYHFSPDNFLKPGKEGFFVGRAEEIREHIEQAFELMLGMPFPSDIKISVCSAQQFKTIAPNPGTVGLSLNRRKQGLLSEIFVLNDSLGRVMLTIGHELGHVLTETLSHSHDEEAKAYAFSLAWMKTIKEHDIAELADAFVDERPAENGLHNVAFGFVQKMISSGKKAWEIYQHLIYRHISVGFVAG